MSAEISPELVERINQTYFVWFTTVRADGMPQPTPVWFVWENGTFLIYSMPDAQKVRNIRANPKVALSASADEEADQFFVIMGEAAIDRQTPPVNQHPAYFAKYEQGIRDIGMTPESMAQTFSLPIRVAPIQVRAE